MNYKFTFQLLLILLALGNLALAQGWNDDKACELDANGDCVPNPQQTALPFMKIIPDARGGSMGDAGVATSADAYGTYYNASKLAFVDKDLELSMTYTPWLRSIGVTDVYVAYLSGYKKIDELSALGFSAGYFNLGKIEFLDADGNALGNGAPREFTVNVSYARKLSQNFSVGLGGKFFNSSLANGIAFQGLTITAATGFAADISATYQSDPNFDGGRNFTAAMALSNLGSKVSYTNQPVKEFIPTNLALGLGYTIKSDDYSKFSFTVEFNKLLIPSRVPALKEFIDNGEFDKYLERRRGSTFSNLFSSFSDAPGGLREEIREIAYSIGAEYWYMDQFAVRGGYYREHSLKGNRQFLTLGIGIKYNVFGFDIGYLAPTTAQRTPLDNTLRFGFTFDLGNLNNLSQQ